MEMLVAVEFIAKGGEAVLRLGHHGTEIFVLYAKKELTKISSWV